MFRGDGDDRRERTCRVGTTIGDRDALYAGTHRLRHQTHGGPPNPLIPAAVAGTALALTPAAMNPAKSPNVSIAGRVTIDRCGDVRRVIADALRPIPPQVTLDLAGLIYIDTCGLATFLEASRRARRQGSRLVLVGVRGQPRELLSFSGIDQVIEVAAADTSDGRDVRR